MVFLDDSLHLNMDEQRLRPKTTDSLLGLSKKSAVFSRVSVVMLDPLEIETAFGPAIVHCTLLPLSHVCQ
jgi:hypothetical protein